jgi:TetR/AcrR family transcriptional regulator, tetracycline repressor protein
MGQPGPTRPGGCVRVSPPDASAAKAPATASLPAERRRLPLSCARILEAALAYADEHGLEELSMRRLGAELDVEAMSLYRYYPSKGALLEAVACRVLGELELPAGERGDWHGHVATYARSLRALALRHPRVFPLLASAGPSNPSVASVFERMVSVWRAAGLDEQRSVRAQCAVQGYVTGAVLWQIGSGDGSDDERAADEDFEFGMGALLEGLRREIARVEEPAGR